MATKKTLGGERLGGGKKMKVTLDNYGRSTFNTSTRKTTTMSCGTVVPVWVKKAVPGAKLKIGLNAKVITQPTIATLMGSYDLEVHVFEAPDRLYQAELMMDKLNVGYDISQIQLPQVLLKAPQGAEHLNNQINPTSIWHALNIAGLGRKTAGEGWIQRLFYATPWLMYWEMYKNFFANKQENKGAVIHTPVPLITETVNHIKILENGNDVWTIPDQTEPPAAYVVNNPNTEFQISYTMPTPPQAGDIEILSDVWGWVKIDDAFITKYDNGTGSITYSGVTSIVWLKSTLQWRYANSGGQPAETKPEITMFDLTNIDDMRTLIMQHAGNAFPFTIGEAIGLEPYNLALETNETDQRTSAQQNQEGFALTTYKSDLFNNWLKTEWVNEINIASRILTGSGSITIDEINFRKKMQTYLNRIAVSGGSYNDYINVTYDIEALQRPISPVYHGSLLKEITFEEVVSTAGTGTQPLGQLAGKGVMGSKHKGGDITIDVKEHGCIMAVAVIRPRVCYSQGNSWMMNLKNLSNIHRPEFDQIGFQDLITDMMDYRSTDIDAVHLTTFKSIGKQTAWINYQTDIDRAGGNFAILNNQMAQVLNRRYEWDENEEEVIDFTTYIDPSKFNYVFADTRLDAQNFNLQVLVDCEERLVMSAKTIPTL